MILTEKELTAGEKWLWYYTEGKFLTSESLSEFLFNSVEYSICDRLDEIYSHPIIAKTEKDKCLKKFFVDDRRRIEREHRN